MTYDFPKSHLSLVTDHAAALDVDILALTLSADVYRMVTAQPFPQAQLEHLGLTEVV